MEHKNPHDLTRGQRSNEKPVYDDFIDWAAEQYYKHGESNEFIRNTLINLMKPKDLILMGNKVGRIEQKVKDNV